MVKVPRVSLNPELVLVGVLAYVILPAEILSDFLIGVGQLDDIVVTLGGLRLFLRLCPPEVVQEHLQAIRTAN